MFKVNDNYLKLPGSYLFSTIGKKVNAYSAAHPDKKIIRLGIGDVTQPLAPAIIDALHGAVDEMGKAETFHGYAPDLGYEFLRNAIAENDYKARGCDIAPDEIFVSDGAKCDCGNIQEIFSLDNKIAVCDPVYPVYVDSNVMAGRTGTYDPKSETWSDVIYMPCLAENGFAPKLPKETPDLIYLCFPNNPTGATITKAQLQEWVDYANKVGGLVIGTGDLSELALGWATYNGDHMSMYGVNASVPKTLVRYLVTWVAQTGVDTDSKATLLDIVDTPISPELIPADENGNIKQKTEDLVGPYELHDFFLYNILRFGFRPAKIYYLATLAFGASYDKPTIKKWLTTFYRRFFAQQFKRSCLPDGPKVGSVSLSPRGDWRMPSDASSAMWLSECEALDEN
mgnify:CR=1 FL=1